MKSDEKVGGIAAMRLTKADEWYSKDRARSAILRSLFFHSLFGRKSPLETALLGQRRFQGRGLWLSLTACGMSLFA
jgi:hypothetical protein